MQAQTNIDSNGYIDRQYYYNAIRDVIERGAVEREIDTSKITTNEVISQLSRAYHAIFEPQDRMLSDPTSKACNVEYNTENLKRLLDIYIEVMRAYNALPSVGGFEVLTGINQDTLEAYVTGSLSAIGKSRKEYVQNRLNNTPIGVMTLANNDRDTGLLYTQQNVIASEVAKKSLSFADLQRIAEKAGD